MLQLMKLHATQENDLFEASEKSAQLLTPFHRVFKELNSPTRTEWLEIQEGLREKDLELTSA